MRCPDHLTYLLPSTSSIHPQSHNQDGSSRSTMLRRLPILGRPVAPKSGLRAAPLAFLVVTLCLATVCQGESNGNEAATADNTAQNVELPDSDHPVHECYGPETDHCRKQDLDCKYYVAMIDAGSTGTRMHILEFGASPDPTIGTVFKVTKEVFNEVKPGLSSFAHNPEKAAESLLPLLRLANDTVPMTHWQYTPLALQATGGLRLLPEKKVDAILSKVRDVFKSSSQFVIQHEHVTVMDGINEGLYAWFTLNYLLEKLHEAPSETKKPETAVALDLGGASTQVTFLPKKKETLTSAPPSFKHTFLLNENITMNLYSHSYLSNGLIEARLHTLKLHSESSQDGAQLVTACLPSDYSFEWDYHSLRYVRGHDNYGYDQCRAQVQQFVKSSNINMPGELEDREIYGFSYYYERIAQAFLIKDAGGSTSMTEIQEAARKACTRSSSELGPEHWRPWQCFDLTYIHSLLSDGYGLPSDKSVFFAKKLAGHTEVSWALGASYNLLIRHLEAIHLAGKDGDYHWTITLGYYVCNQIYTSLHPMLKLFNLFN